MFIAFSSDRPDYRPVAHAASGYARIAGLLAFAGYTFHEPSACRKKTMVKLPSVCAAPTRT
jgi:hypothetical protein